MKENFGTDEFILKLKQAYMKQEWKTVESLLEPKVYATARSILYREQEFRFDTQENKEKALNEAWVQMLEEIGGFLSNERNDPSSPEEIRYSQAEKQSWFRGRIRNILRHSLEKDRKYRVISQDAPIAPDSDMTVSDTIPASTPTPEEVVLLKERFNEVLTAFFSLGHAPEMIAAVGFIILQQALESKKYSLDEYSSVLSGKPTIQILQKIKKILIRWETDPAVINPLLKRLRPNSLIPNLTPQKLANRKNHMLASMRAGPLNPD